MLSVHPAGVYAENGREMVKGVKLVSRVHGWKGVLAGYRDGCVTSISAMNGNGFPFAANTCEAAWGSQEIFESTPEEAGNGLWSK